MLGILATIFTVFVMLEHLYILYMEMFAWETRGKAFFAQAMPAIIAICLSLVA
ncbi:MULTISPECIES: conserved domain protein [Capnocytophaga]|uniref:conserved domain protein n=1 Tax=Capnocytophaga TaxID=1016 RepID=UPI00020C6D4E|nr:MULTISPECIES: conserved domain protein [unclassified Capnocytophaga]KHE70113.1 hypothetical protein HMPREF9074_07931 [Capnocytophaga sp. oral taxon 329 str. F0087]QGS17034.1 hypothetical protein FOC45_01670 [Capnocytophaga sp. FDAARGOS_737]